MGGKEHLKGIQHRKRQRKEGRKERGASKKEERKPGNKGNTTGKKEGLN
jgi:hypothetical protein